MRASATALGWRSLWRDLRAGELKLLIVAVTLAVVGAAVAIESVQTVVPPVEAVARPVEPIWPLKAAPGTGSNVGGWSIGGFSRTSPPSMKLSGPLPVNVPESTVAPIHCACIVPPDPAPPWKKVLVPVFVNV